MTKSAILVSLLLACLSWPAAAQEIGMYSQMDYPPPATDDGELLVDFQDAEEPGIIVSLLRGLGLGAGQYSWLSDEERLLRVSNLGGDLLERLKGRADVEGVEPNYYMSAFTVPNDPYYKYQWHLDMIGMRKAWEYPRGAGVVVAVIDTGIAFENYRDRFVVEDLDPSQFVSPYNFLTKDKHPNDDHGHGTHVAGTIAQLTNNAKGVAGVAPAVRLMPLKVLNRNGYGTISDIAAAIRYAADHGANVINMSLGGPFPSFTLHKAVKYAHRKGVVIVCAAGNSGRAGISYPAAYPECISVSAVRYDGKLTWYSSYGRGLTLAAPGGDLNEDQNGDGLMDGVLQNTLFPQDTTKQGYYLFQGTSMAAPHVAAAAALLMSQGVTDPESVRRYLQKSAALPDGGSSEHYGAGLLKVDAALERAFWTRRIRLLILAIVIFLALLTLLNRGRERTEKVRANLLSLLGLLLASTGAFFAAKMPIIGAGFLVTHSVEEWPAALLGASAFSNPLLLSAGPVLMVAMLCYPWKRWTALSVGFAAGYGALLLFQAASPTVDVAWIPGSLLQSAWLAGNALVSLGIAAVASFRLK
jgi:serine protease